MLRSSAPRTRDDILQMIDEQRLRILEKGLREVEEQIRQIWRVVECQGQMLSEMNRTHRPVWWKLWRYLYAR